MAGGIRKTFSIILIALISAISPLAIYSQSTGTPDNGLFFKANLGFNYFYGDLANQENSFFSRFSAGSNLGFSFGTEKYFTSKYSAGLNLMFGKLSNYNTLVNKYFESKISEISFYGKLHFLEFMETRPSMAKFHPYLSAGIGILNYSTELKVIQPELQILAPQNAITTVFPLGLGFNYNLKENIDLNLDIGMRISLGDSIDGIVGAIVKSDKYTFISAGVKYRFDLNKLKKTSGQSTTQATSTSQTTKNTPGIRRTSPKKTVAKNPVKARSNLDADGMSDAARKYWEMVNKEKADKQIVYRNDFTNTLKEENIPETVQIKKYLSEPVKKKEYIPDNTIIEEKKKETDSSIDRKNQTSTLPVIEGDITVISEVPTQINAGDTFTVNLTIVKGMNTGGLEIKQTFSRGFTPIIPNSGNAIFEFNEPNVIIRWKNLPPEERFSYSYNVRTDNNILTTNHIYGLVSWPLSGIPRLKGLKNTIITENSTSIPQSQSTITQTSYEYTSGNNEYTKNSIVYGKEYRVQIGAFKDQFSKNGLLKRFNITDPVKEDFQNGWYRYTVGSFTELNQAKNFRDNFIQRTGHLSAYLVLFNNGIRQKDLRIR